MNGFGRNAALPGGCSIQVSRHEHNLDPTTLGQLPQFQPVHLGHLHVAQNSMDRPREFPREVQGAFPIVGGENEIAFVFQRNSRYVSD